MENQLGEYGDIDYIKSNLKEEIIEEIKKPIATQDLDKHYKDK
jgi:hypothetical protein